MLSHGRYYVSIENRMESLFKTIDQFLMLSPEIQESLSSKTKVRNLKKKELLLEPNKCVHSIFFVNRGLLRGFFYQKRKDITTWFSLEGEIITSISSLITGKPSLEGIEALEDCELGEISYEDLNQLYKTFPELNKLGRMLMEFYYIELEERAIHFQFKTAKERYEYFLSKYSQAFHRIPLTHIASYLGITKETLSRIRS